MLQHLQEGEWLSRAGVLTAIQASRRSEMGYMDAPCQDELTRIKEIRTEEISKEGKVMKNEESRIQRNCVIWMRLQWPQYFPVFFSVPNGGNRNAITGSILKAEGAKAGVSDLILLVPRKGYSSLCIEMKQPKGKQSEAQVEFEKQVTKHGNKYVVCHSLEEFIKEIEAYLNE